MTIYGRTGDVVTLKRIAVEGDVLKFEGRQPDAQDRMALNNLSYVVVEQDDSIECLYHLAYLRASGGSKEIDGIIDDLVVQAVASAPARFPPTHVIDQAGQPYGSVRQCCNQCGQMATLGMIVVDSVAEWSDLPPERRCDRSRAKEAT